jgi:hypothetical protein
MYDALIAAMFPFGAFGRRRLSQRPAGSMSDLSEFNDHTLRDIGMRREPPAWDRRHLMRF